MSDIVLLLLKYWYVPFWLVLQGLIFVVFIVIVRRIWKKLWRVKSADFVLIGLVYIFFPIAALISNFFQPPRGVFNFSSGAGFIDLIAWSIIALTGVSGICLMFLGAIFALLKKGL